MAKTLSKDEQIKALKAGNTKLLEALMGMVNQFFYHENDSDVLSHSFMSAEEYAIDTLIESGFAQDTDDGYVLDYEKLDKRVRGEQINSKKK